MLKKSIQKELGDFFKEMNEEKSISKSAFCQSRLKLKPEAFLDLNEVFCKGFYADPKLKKWHGFRLIGIDGSTLRLPNSEEIIKVFGYQTNQIGDKFPLAKISTCFDLLNEIIIDPVIATFNSSEYQLAKEHIMKLGKGDLAILDRGYGATWMFYLLTNKEIDFVIRITKNVFKEFWESAQQSQILTIERLGEKSKNKIKEIGLSFSPFKIRLVKVILETGETEVLATSLLDEKAYPPEVFKDLYFCRWGIEEAYNHLKNHLELENFSGKSACAIKQDFYANALLENLRALFSKGAEEKLKAHKNNTKYEYKINRNLSLGFLKDEIVRLLLSDNPDSYEKIEKLFIIEPIPIRRNRKFDRIFHLHRLHFRMNYRRSI
jgi:hypothetical protein